MSHSLPEHFFDMMPLPILVVEHKEDTLNHPLVMLNKAFADKIGWSLEEIPDKNTWWHTAYPDENYQKVVEQQWELIMESAETQKNGFVNIPVNIMTKHHGIKRFNVYTEIRSALLPGYYVVAFEEIPL